MRLAVCGGRAFPDRQFVYDTLDRLHHDHVDGLLCDPGITELAAGDAGKLAPLSGRLLGVDLQALTWADSNDIPRQRFIADWTSYGRGAGPVRNRKMLDDFQPDLLVVFPGGAGTADCKRAALERSIEILEVSPEQTAEWHPVDE